ncbi:MAG: sialate O-acetylesterase [Oscillatoria sp. PMC 1068.18]|nr:sialate O-acetylesterase [Oscillatoria sp. PMC 1076.18]MEC4991738.1 sialate O-acetylesterase [Oscillatoria sp. PMC 1068.18]
MKINHILLFVQIGLIVGSLLGGIATPVQAETLCDRTSLNSTKLFILAGQSNMVGSQSDLALLPPHLLEPQEQVLWYDNNNQWNLLQPPTEPFPFSKVNNGVGFGPEISLGRKIAANLNETVALVKYAQGGTSLAEDWQPGSDLYNRMIERVNSAKSDCAANLDVAGFFWMQGEKDATQADFANSYQSNLNYFIDRVREDLNSPELPFILGKTFVAQGLNIEYNSYNYADTVRSAQSSFAELDFTCCTLVVETEDLSRHSDQLHLDSQGLVDLGERFGTAWLKTHHKIPESSMWGILGGFVLVLLCTTRQKSDR